MPIAFNPLPKFPPCNTASLPRLAAVRCRTGGEIKVFIRSPRRPARGSLFASGGAVPSRAPLERH